MMSGGRLPLWVWGLMGWLLAGVIYAWSRAEDEAPRVVDEGQIEWELETMNPRELRVLPQIGHKRAVQIADQRWDQELGPPPDVDIQRVRGIGPKTSGAVGAFLLNRQRAIGPSMVPPPSIPRPRPVFRGPMHK